MTRVENKKNLQALVLYNLIPTQTHKILKTIYKKS